MSWPFAIFAMFSVLVLSSVSFLLIIYFKEFAKENKILDSLSKNPPILDILIPVSGAMPKKKSKAAEIGQEAPAKPKKDTNLN
jgi:hypothetical protein